jgi:Domain of unknown function (DUF1735)
MKQIINIAVLVEVLFSAGCLKDTSSTDFTTTGQTILQMEYPPAAQYFGFGSGLEYFTGCLLSYSSTDIADTVIVYVNIDGTHTLKTGLDLSIGSAGNSHLEDNYSKDSITYSTMPDSDYSIFPPSATIQAGFRLDTFHVIFYPSRIDTTQNFMLPLTVTNTDGYPVSGNFGIIYFHTIAL